MREGVLSQGLARSPKSRIEPVNQVPSTRELEDAVRRAEALKKTPALLDEVTVGLFGGLLIGATVGIVAGSPGIIAGAIIGAIVGIGAGVVWGDIDYLKSIHDDRIDRELGVVDGLIGTTPGPHPAPTHGLYHASTLGVGGTGANEVDEGPNPWLHPHATE